MLLTKSILSNIEKDFNFNFISGDDFFWNHKNKTITYNSDDENGLELLFHEIGHAKLNHANYLRDIQLIEMEREAWSEAKKIASKMQLRINQNIIEDHMDSYRDWLHARSLCPECKSNGYEYRKGYYTCPVCTTKWQVNDAKLCQLRRTVIK